MEHMRIVVVSNAIAIPVSILVMGKWLANFQYQTEMGILVFLKTLVITSVFTLLAVSLLIIRTHKTKLLETLNHA